MGPNTSGMVVLEYKRCHANEITLTFKLSRLREEYRNQFQR